MIFVWGKRSYGAVNKVGNVSVKTMFGHLWYLPLFPMTSYYFVEGSESAFALKRINWRSVFCGYVRVWAPIVFLFTLIGMRSAHVEGGKIAAGVMLFATAAAFIASYVLDKKFADKDGAQVRDLMQRHFGVAVDPYECASSLLSEINQKMQSLSAAQLEEHWYKRTLGDAFSPAGHVELALLRPVATSMTRRCRTARCKNSNHARQRLKAWCSARP